MNNIIAFYPFSKTSKSDEEGSYEWEDGCRKPVNWHIVLFDKWINTHIPVNRLSYKCQFSLSFANGNKWGKYEELCFIRYFGKDLDEDDNGKDYHFSLIRLPWYKEMFEHTVLIKGDWITLPLVIRLDGNYKTYEALMDKSDKTTYTFSAYGKKIKATCHAEQYRASVYWFPKWLKELFYKVEKFIEIDFSDDIGKGRGSWKGGILGLNAEWKGSIRNSWYHFKNTRLKEILND